MSGEDAEIERLPDPVMAATRGRERASMMTDDATMVEASEESDAVSFNL